MQFPVPPPPGVIPVKVSICPAQTVDATGDLVAVGAEGSATTIHEYELTDEISQSEPSQLVRMSMEFGPATEAVTGVKVGDQVVPPS